MLQSMAIKAKGNQVAGFIMAKLAPWLHMVDV